MDIIEYRDFLEGMALNELEDYLYKLDFDSISVDERRELERYLAELKAKKVLAYLAVFGLLSLVESVLIEKLSLTKPTEDELKDPGEFGRKFDLVFTTTDTPCDECAAEDGKIYGKETDRIPGPGMHPHCMCKFVKVYREETPKMKAMNLKWAPGGAVRAMRSTNDKMALEVLAAPFGGPERKDRLGQYLSARTDYMIEIGDRRPTLYLHGFSPRRRAMEIPSVLGIAEVSRIDDEGVWMYTELDDSPLSRRTWDAAKRGEARASTGSIAHLARPQNRSDGSPTPGEVTCWPIAELSVWDGKDDIKPVSDDAIVIPLRALFEKHELEFDERFEAGEDKNLDGSKRSASRKELDVDPEELQGIIDKSVAGALKAERESLIDQKKVRADMKASILDELKEDPKYRAIFNVTKIKGDRGLEAAELESFVYVRGLIEDGKRVFAGGMPIQHAMRVLEESEALELGPMVPEDLLNKIHTFRGKYSIVRKAGMTIYQTEKLIFSVPAETTATAVLPTIAEEGAYVANEAAFAAKTATMLKKGSLIAVTEEALEDQDLFQQWIAKACGKAVALSENAVLNVLTTAIAGVEVAATHTLTDAELLTGYYALLQEYREGATFLMNDLTLAYIRAMLVATPRAYGEFGFQPLSMGEAGEHLMNHRVFTNANWDPITTAADDVKIIDFINLDEAIYWVERRGLSIFVDPYSTRAAAGTINFLPSARFNGVTVNAAACSGIDDHA